MISCTKEDAGLSEVPSIEFVSIEIEKNTFLKDSVIHITFSYADGDGDIGLGDEDTLPPFDYNSAYWQNVPVKIFHKQGNNYVELLNPGTNEPFRLPSERIPRISPAGKNKAITGSITVHLPANPLNTQPKEVKYELNLIDRNLNISNTITTPSVTLSH